jgi:hypothetical protein
MWYTFTDVSEVLAASIIRAIVLMMGAATLRNVCKLLPDYMAEHPRRQSVTFILAGVRT